MCAKIIKFSVSSCCLVCCLRSTRTEWMRRPNYHSLLSRQFHDWEHPVSKAGCWEQFALLLLWLDLLVTGGKPSAGQQFPAHPFSTFPQKYIPLGWRRRSVIVLPITKKKLLHTFFTGRTGLPKNSPDSCLCRWLLCAKYYLSWIPGLLFSFYLQCRVSQLLKAPRCKCTILLTCKALRTPLPQTINNDPYRRSSRGEARNRWQR